MQDEQKDTASIEVIQRRIMRIRGDRVMPDHHLAELYGVETKQLKPPLEEISAGFHRTSCLNLRERNTIL